MIRKLPKIPSEAAKEWCRLYDSGTHEDKLRLCIQYGVGYQQGVNFRTACKLMDIPREPFTPPDATWEKHLDVIRQMNDLVDIHQRIPQEITVKIATNKPIAVGFTADWQLGQHGVDYVAFQHDCNTWEKEDGLYVYIGGDAYQNIIQPGKMGSSHNQTPIAVQKGLYVLTVQKLQKKILAVGTGNHNYWTALADGEDWDYEMLKHLNLVYTKHGGMLNFVVGSMVYPIFRQHISRYNSVYNPTHAPKQNQRLDHPDARVIVTEHRHIAAVEQYRYNDKECVAIQTGTYATYDDYAQSYGFYGSHIANPTVVFYPNEDKIVPFKDMDEAIVYLRAVRV